MPRGPLPYCINGPLLRILGEFFKMKNVEWFVPAPKEVREISPHG